MNYGRKSASKRREKISSKRNMKRKRTSVRLFYMSFFIVILVCLAGVFGASTILKKIVSKAPDITAEDIKPTAHMSTVYANDGTTVLDTFVDAGSNRIYVSIDEIPEHMQTGSR